MLAPCVPTRVDGYRGFGEKCCPFLYGQMIGLNVNIEVLWVRIRLHFTGADKRKMAIHKVFSKPSSTSIKMVSACSSEALASLH
jgi:hypothetical protein